MSDGAGIEVRRFDELAWRDNPRTGNTTSEMLARAEAQGYRRKPLVEGQGGVHLTHVEMGPAMRVEPHAHDAAEVIHVLAGSLLPDGEGRALATGDSLVVPAGAAYGFTVGPDGVTFLIARPSAAGIDHQA